MRFYLLAAVAVGVLLAGAALAQVPPTRHLNDTARQTGQSAGAVARSLANVANAATIDRTLAAVISRINSMQRIDGPSGLTMAEARSLLEQSGYLDVSNLAKDRDGIWRGIAMKDGSQEDVWVAYTGDTGTGKPRSA